MENKEINKEIFNMEDLTVYRNVDGKLEEAKKVEKEKAIPTTFRLREKSLERYNYLYEQQSKTKGDFASDIIDSFFKWFAIDECVTKEDLDAKDEEIKALKKEIAELKKATKTTKSKKGSTKKEETENKDDEEIK